MNKRTKLLSLVLICALAVAMILPGTPAEVKASSPSFSVISIEDNDFHGCKIQYSTDGTNWTDITSTMGATAASHLRIVLADGYEVAGHTAIRVAGADVLQSNLATFTGNSGYALTGGSEYQIENIQFLATGGNGGGGGAPGFNGNCYIAWLDGDTFRYHHFTGLSTDNSVNYFAASTVVDDVTGANAISPTLTSNNYEFLWDSFNPADSTFAALTSGAEKLAYVKDRDNGFSIDPVGAYDEANAISTNGDRAFKLTIYNDTPGNYEGITVGGDGTYSLGSWAFKNNTIDVSGTSASSPKEYDAYVGNESLTLAANTQSATITAVEPVGVPAKAVTVTSAGGTFTIAFHSNYYDNVVFKITDNAGGVNYLRINRLSMRVEAEPGTGNRVLALYYPSAKSYSNYSVLFTTTAANGSISSKVVSANATGYDADGNAYANYEVAEGVGLKKACYAIPSDAASGFSVTVVEGAMSSTNYPGTLAGRSTGVTFTVVNGQLKQVQ